MWVRGRVVKQASRQKGKQASGQVGKCPYRQGSVQVCWEESKLESREVGNWGLGQGARMGAEGLVSVT